MPLPLLLQQARRKRWGWGAHWSWSFASVSCTFSKDGALSNDLKGVVMKSFLGGKPSNPCLCSVQPPPPPRNTNFVRRACAVFQTILWWTINAISFASLLNLTSSLFYEAKKLPSSYYLGRPFYRESLGKIQHSIWQPFVILYDVIFEKFFNTITLKFCSILLFNRFVFLSPLFYQV